MLAEQARAMGHLRMIWILTRRGRLVHTLETCLCRPARAARQGLAATVDMPHRGGLVRLSA